MVRLWPDHRYMLNRVPCARHLTTPGHSAHVLHTHHHNSAATGLTVGTQLRPAQLRRRQAGAPAGLPLGTRCDLSHPHHVSAHPAAACLTPATGPHYPVTACLTGAKRPVVPACHTGTIPLCPNDPAAFHRS